MYFSNRENNAYFEGEEKEGGEIFSIEQNVVYNRMQLYLYFKYNHSLGKSGLDSTQTAHFVKMCMIHYEKSGGFNSEENPWFYDVLEHGLTHIVSMNFQDTKECIKNAICALTRELYAKSKQNEKGEDFIKRINTLLYCIEIGEKINLEDMIDELRKM